MTSILAGIVAVCEVVTPGQRYQHLRELGWPAAECLREVSASENTIRFAIQEFAVQHSGVSVPLRRRVGFGSSPSRGDAAAHWRHMSVSTATREVLNAVLPDDAEQSGQPHPWGEFVEGLRAAGIHASPEELQRLPYSVIFAPRLYDLLTGAADGVDFVISDLRSARRAAD